MATLSKTKIPVNIIFFGSTEDSVIVINSLYQCSNVAMYQWRVCAVVTQPPRSVGRQKVITPTPVEVWAKKHNLLVISFSAHPDKPWLFEDEQKVASSLVPLSADLLLTASYGQKIPLKTILDARWGGFNVHPSLLPRWRGADPVPWAIASGDHQIGVSIVTLAEKFDQGRLIAQKKIPITSGDWSDPLRTKLFALGGNLLVALLPDYLSGKIKGKPQPTMPTPYARRLTRQDGFEPWDQITDASGSAAARIERKLRGFSPWPGLWTIIKIKNEDKRLKILSAHLEAKKLILDKVQLEGKKPVSFLQFIAGYNLRRPPSLIPS